MQADEATDTKASRKRVTRACDQCRRTRGKCDLTGHGPCTSCANAGLQCTAEGTARKRGPAKGYNHLLELRIRELDGVIATIISSEEPAIKLLVHQLEQNQVTKAILDSVRDRRTRLATGTSSLQDHFRETGGPSTSPSLSQSLHSFTPSDVLASPTSSHGVGYSTSHSSTSPFGVTGDDDDLDADGDEEEDYHSGEFTMGDREQLYFSGSSSGLPFLSKVSRTDASQQDGIWNLILPSSLPSIAPTIPVILPPTAVQDQLLAIYFEYVHIVFPVIAKDQFLSRFHATNMAGMNDSFDLLLLSIFSIASRIPGYDNPPSDHYYELAKLTLAKFYTLSHPTTAASLLLLALRDFGMGNRSQAWLFAGLAIRMAQDLGLHTSSHLKGTSGRQVFDDRQIAVRKRLWYGCIKMDSYLSMYSGQPLAIRDPQWDTDIDLNYEEELGIWIQPGDQTAIYQPVHVRTISMFNANIHLSMLAGRIITELYKSPKPKVPNAATADMFRKDLEEWYNTLPTFLQITDHSSASRAPPNVITLHTEYWSVMILLYRPLMQHDKSDSNTRAWEICIGAAQNVTDLVQTFGTQFSLAQASNPLLVHNVFHAGLIWVAALNFYSVDPRYALNLAQCSSALNDMKNTHAAATDFQKLLDGTVVSTLRNPPAASVHSHNYISTNPSPPVSLEESALFNELLWS